MHCPRCGVKNSANSKICKFCGVDLEEETTYLKFAEYKTIIAVTLPVAMFLFLILTSNKNYVYIPLIISIPVILFLEFRYPSSYSKYCPKCNHSDFNGNFCIKCGYNLNDVWGYFDMTNHDIEVNRNHIKIYRKIASESVGDMVKSSPETFELNKIENICVSRCKSFLFEHSCLKFDYLDEKCKGHYAHRSEGRCVVKVALDKKNEYLVDKLMNLEVYRDKIGY